MGGPPGFLKVLDDKTLGFADFRSNRRYISVGNVGANDRAALILMDYPNRRRLKIYAHEELRDLKDDTDLAQRLASPGYKAKVERAVLLRQELPAAHHAALHRARVGASARAGQVAHPRPGKRGEGAPRRQLLPGQRGKSGAAEDEVRDT
jgi:predicted pyridoxine 5'-phosphate oxidase superfamily flavin-nucleotide-binding protein